jgi:hypothetical protein
VELAHFTLSITRTSTSLYECRTITPAPTTAEARQIAAGPVERLSLRDAPSPRPAAGPLVRVTVAAPEGHALPQGQVQSGRRFPKYCGVDFAGVIEHPSFNLYERRANKLDKKLVVNFIQTRFEREAYPHTGAAPRYPRYRNVHVWPKADTRSASTKESWPRGLSPRGIGIST